MSAGDLERALELTRVDDGIWRATADPNYVAANGMFGGWTAAVALGAVCETADGDVTPSALTINYVNVIDPATEVHIRTRRVGGGRSVRHWQSELTAPGQDDPLAFASVMLTARRETDGLLDVQMPAAPDPDTLEEFHPPGTFGERTGLRTFEGFPPFGRGTTRSHAWARESSGRPVDHLQLAFLSDARPPRSWYWSEGPRPSATLTLSVYFHATAAELAAVGDDFVLSEAFGIRGAQSTSEEHLRLWSRQGALLATSEQLAWYR
jgi:acyl-CoA thioesterase